MNKCERCQKREASIIVTGDGQEQLCVSCFNDRLSKDLGVQLESMPEEIVVNDHSKTRRKFVVQQRLYPNGLFLEATEDIEYGYQFAVHGEIDCNQEELFQKLVEKVKHGVHKKFTKVGKFLNGQTYHSIIGDEVVGRIDHDERRSSEPMIVIDGQPYTWVQLGEMVKSYEGFQLQIKFFDMTDDVE
ncbi:hypothetical protein J5S49_02045 [Virgibacillus halodenitrificans]|uniref:DUF7686 domain-containing protein n=1 Tax=Virgibacillus halodenitrificans TaxID=1482 RepID=UPI001F263408|nr:hypothetical protein [Virgibacillus halodenitrificans]MCG1027070.1 hypothetical protein [Virgibacillus halodenitrificans]